MRIFSVLITLLLLMLMGASAGAQTTTASVQPCGSPQPNFTCQMVSFGTFDGLNGNPGILVAQEIHVTNPAFITEIMTPQGITAFIEGVNSGSPNAFVVQSDVSDAFVTKLTISTETQPFEIFVFSGTSSVTGSTTPASVALLTVNGTLYTFLTTNLDEDDFVGYVNHIIDGGSFTDIPDGFIDATTLM